LAAATAERTALDETITELSAEVASQTACLAFQTSDLTELTRIAELQTANFNRSAEGSTWAKAEAAREKAIKDALDAYYQAYSKAFDGAISSARAWAAKGKDAEAAIAAQAKQQAAELALIDRSAAEIEAALDALEKQLASTQTSCTEVAP
jgi:Tfp pilus assembly protein PilO